MPISIPVLKENPIQLEIPARIGCAQVNSHISLRVRMYEKLVYRARFHGDLAIIARYFSHDSIEFNAHQPAFDAEIFGLELMEM